MTSLARVKKAIENLRPKDKNTVPDKNASTWNLDFLKHIAEMKELSEKAIQNELSTSPEVGINRLSDNTTDSSNKKEGAEENAKGGDNPSLARVLKEMIKSVTDASQKRLSQSSIRIGHSDIPREKVTIVGDVDGNGFEDYIVANPASMNDTGTIRLYLMSGDNKFLYTRDLVPGKYGFVSSPLAEGDRFGDSVEKIASDTPNFSFVTVTAPGDRTVAGGKGAFYILQISDKGNVINSAKLSAKTIETVVAQSANGGDAKYSHDLSRSILSKKIVDILSNKTSMLLVRKGGEIKGAYVISSAEDQKMLHNIEKKMTPRKKLASLRLDTPLVRADISSSCFFNDTHCACASNPPPVGSMQCTQVTGTEASTGKTLCETRDCKASFSCMCDGAELCMRTERTLTSYVVEGPAPGGGMYCNGVQKTITENVVIPGAPVPVILNVNELPPYNATHCRCAKKQSVTGGAVCMDVLRALGGVNYVCSPRDCRIGPNEYICDAFGDSYCSRTFIEKIHYVNDGEKTDEAGAVFCHREAYQAESVTKIVY
ncbi:Integrin alpha [Gracilaria domingensis]|nr:Integrin alpha [Gracilaria domingensis]